MHASFPQECIISTNCATFKPLFTKHVPRASLFTNYIAEGWFHVRVRTSRIHACKQFFRRRRSRFKWTIISPLKSRHIHCNWNRWTSSTSSCLQTRKDIILVRLTSGCWFITRNMPPKKRFPIVSGNCKHFLRYYVNWFFVFNPDSSIMMRRVHDKARVHFSIALMVISAAGMFGSSLLGKYKSHHGQTLNTQQEYMKQYNENKIKEQHLEAPVLEKSWAAILLFFCYDAQTRIK